GTPALLRHARAHGWRSDGQWEADGRPFVALRRERTARTASSSAESAKSPAVIRSQLPRNLSGDIPLAEA
ncbi:class I SAM-dependent methyltransferase, partial [Streptomyces sp. ZG43]